MEEARYGVPDHHRHSRREPTDGHGSGGDDERSQSLPVGARVCRLAQIGARTSRYWRQGEIAERQQTRHTYLRTLLIHGARSLLCHAKEPGAWVEQIQKRQPANVVTVALTNKMARTI